MKHLQRMLILGIALLSFYSCQKDEISTPDPGSLRTDATTKTPKSPYKGTRLKEIRSWYRSFVIFYNKHGNIDSIRGQDNYPGTSRYTYIAYYTKSKLDSIHVVLRGKIESATTNIQYKGDLIVQSDYWTQRPTQPFPTVRPLNYDNKKRLLNSNTQGKFTYDEAGAIVELSHPIYPELGQIYTVDYRINPLHLVPYFFLVLIEDYNIAEFWYNPYNTTSQISKDGRLAYFYHNEYNEKGQLVKKSWTEYGNPQYLIYIYE
jgi:hypothetical protein